MTELNKAIITITAILSLTLIAIMLIYAKADNSLIILTIIAISGLAGYKIKKEDRDAR